MDDQAAELLKQILSATARQDKRLNQIELLLRQLTNEGRRIPIIEVNRLPPGPPSTLLNKLGSIRRYIEEAAADAGVIIREINTTEEGTVLRQRQFLEEAASFEATIPGFKLPRTRDFAAFHKDPRFPVMAKLKRASRGLHKYVLDDERQLETFQRWLQTHGDSGDWIFQDFIECPSLHYSSIRVIVDCLGTIYSSQILYGAPYRCIGMAHADRAHSLQQTIIDAA